MKWLISTIGDAIASLTMKEANQLTWYLKKKEDEGLDHDEALVPVGCGPGSLSGGAALEIPKEDEMEER